MLHQKENYIISLFSEEKKERIHRGERQR
jgi:hypothetical protein